MDWVALLKPDKVTCLRVDGAATRLTAELPLVGGAWTSIVAGRFTTTGAPCLLVYAAATGAWQLLVANATTLVFGDAGKPGSFIDPLPTGATDLIPGQFGGDGLTDLFLWQGGSVEGTIVTTSGSDGFDVLVDRWSDWQMSLYACPVAVPGSVPDASPDPPGPVDLTPPDALRRTRRSTNSPRGRGARRRKA